MCVCVSLPRYEVRVEACTLLGCAASDWASVLTLESPPAGQPAPLLELQPDPEGIQTVFLLSWSPPATPNGRLLHYELLRREVLQGEGVTSAVRVYHNASASYRDTNLTPYTAYEYQVCINLTPTSRPTPHTSTRSIPTPTSHQPHALHRIRVPGLHRHQPHALHRRTYTAHTPHIHRTYINTL